MDGNIKFLLAQIQTNLFYLLLKTLQSKDHFNF